jgi:hypothetical protein
MTTTSSRSILTVIYEVNLDVYDYCYYNGSSQLTGNSKKFHSQESILKQFAKKGKF